MNAHDVHSRELPVAPAQVGALLDGLGSPDDRLWPGDLWPTTPLELDGPLGVGVRCRQGQIRQVVDEYEPGRRVTFRFSPGLGLVGTHRFEVEPLGEDGCRLTHTLETRVEPKLWPVYPILLAQHKALVEDLLDRAELLTTGRMARPARWPLSVRIANALELAVLRLPERRARPRGRRLPSSAYTSRPWRVHEIAGDFELEDVWQLPTPGGRYDLALLVRQFTRQEDDELPAPVRVLFALRWKLGELFGWDEAGAGVGDRVPSVRERLPADLLDGPRGPDLRAVPGRVEHDGPPVFTSVFQTRDEWVAELANETVHSLLHIGWVPDGAGGFHAQMAVLVKPNGRRGRAYMAAIKPFRLAIVYPLLLRAIGRKWRQSTSTPESATAALTASTGGSR